MLVKTLWEYQLRLEEIFDILSTIQWLNSQFIIRIKSDILLKEKKLYKLFF
jgi:hypothetical protein